MEPQSEEQEEEAAREPKSKLKVKVQPTQEERKKLLVREYEVEQGGKKVKKQDLVQKVSRVGFVPAPASPQWKKPREKTIPFSDPNCKKWFVSNKTLKTHHKEFHAKDPAVKCPVCNKRHVSHARMEEHLVIHTKEKKVQCQFCEEKFTQRSSKKEHERTQHGEYRWICWVCEHFYLSKKCLMSHHRRKHQGLLYLCLTCRRAFYSDSSKNIHVCKTPKQKEMKKMALEQKAQKLKKLLETVKKEERKLTQKRKS